MSFFIRTTFQNSHMKYSKTWQCQKGVGFEDLLSMGRIHPIHYTVNIDGKGVDVARRIIPESEWK